MKGIRGGDPTVGATIPGLAGRPGCSKLNAAPPYVYLKID